MNQLLLIILAALQFAVFLILMLGKLFIRSIDPKGNLYSIDKWDKALIAAVILCISVTAMLFVVEQNGNFPAEEQTDGDTPVTVRSSVPRLPEMINVAIGQSPRESSFVKRLSSVKIRADGRSRMAEREATVADHFPVPCAAAICALCVLHFAKLLTYAINCHTCSSGNPAKDIIPVPGDPFLIIQNNWPSGNSFIIDPQVKFRGGGTSAAPMNPWPLPFSPWHIAQASGWAVCKNSVLPA